MHIIVLDGQIVGTWKRTVQSGVVTLTPNFFVPLNEVEHCAFIASAKRYSEFLKLSVSVTD